MYRARRGALGAYLNQTTYLSVRSLHTSVAQEHVSRTRVDLKAAMKHRLTLQGAPEPRLRAGAQAPGAPQGPKRANNPLAAHPYGTRSISDPSLLTGTSTASPSRRACKPF